MNASFPRRSGSTAVLERDAIKHALTRARYFYRTRNSRRTLTVRQLIDSWLAANNAEQEQVEEVVSLDYAAVTMENWF